MSNVHVACASGAIIPALQLMIVTTLRGVLGALVLPNVAGRFPVRAKSTSMFVY